MKVGRPRNVENPDELYKYWEEYKDFLKQHPDKEEVVTMKGDIVTKKTDKPLLKQGFIAFVYRKYKKNVKDYLDGRYDEFSDVAMCIRNEWEENQVTGTMTGKYKSSTLVARLNGYTEKTENKNEHTGTIELTMNLD
jgi:hypothetical protein